MTATEGCYLQVLGNHVRIPCIFHCILMVFQQGMRYFLTLSNAAQSSGHSFSSWISATSTTTTIIHHCHHYHSTITTTTADESFVFTSSSFSSNNSFRKHLNPPMSCACCSSWKPKGAPRKTPFFSEQWASVWPRGIMSFFGCRFVIVRVIGWDTWLDQKKTAKQ